jgi:hypothetical protein
LAPDVVEASSAEGRIEFRPVLAIIRKEGRTVVAGIGGGPVADPAATQVDVFSSDFTGRAAEQDEMVERFVYSALKQLPRSGGFLMPIVIVEGVDSLSAVLGGRHRDVITRALARWGAAIAVMLQRAG